MQAFSKDTIDNIVIGKSSRQGIYYVLIEFKNKDHTKYIDFTNRICAWRAYKKICRRANLVNLKDYYGYDLTFLDSIKYHLNILKIED